MPNKYYEFEFPTSGYKINIRKVPPTIVDEVQRRIPRPTPPMQTVKIGEEIREEANQAHPDYINALMEWDTRVQEETMRTIVRLGVAYTLTKEDLERLEEVREYYNELGMGLRSKNDLENWIVYVAAVSKEDYEALIQQVLSVSMPTPKSN